MTEQEIKELNTLFRNRLLNKLSIAIKHQFCDNPIWTMVKSKSNTVLSGEIINTEKNCNPSIFNKRLLSYPVDTEYNESWKLSIFDLDAEDQEKILNVEDYLPRQASFAVEEHERDLANTLWRLLDENVTGILPFSDGETVSLKENVSEKAFLWINTAMEDGILHSNLYNTLNQNGQTACFNDWKINPTNQKGFLISKGAIDFYSNTVDNVEICESAKYIGVFGENGSVFRLSQEINPPEPYSVGMYRYYIDFAYGLNIDYSKIFRVNYT